MKKIKNLSLVFAMIVAATVSSCSKDDDNGGGLSTPAGGFIQAKIDGATFQATGAYVIAQYDSGSFQIAGVKTDGTTLNVNVGTGATGLEAGKTYNLSSTNDPSSSNYFGSMYYAIISGGTADTYNSAACDNTEGTLKITSVTATQIEGTFSYKGKKVSDDCSGGVKNVTEGSFRALLD